MSDITPLIPRQPVPALSVPTLNGGTFSIEGTRGDPFTLIVFYRGLHCPICKQYLSELQKELSTFTEMGIEVVTISSDTEERARKAQEQWGVDKLTIGYGLPLAKAREWGLYVSTARNEKEPAYFSEPGLYLVRPDGTLYAGAVQTMPFARPHFADLAKGLRFIIDNDYPGRGEVVTLPAEAIAAE